MRELFRERDYTRVGFYQSILESAGIATFVRNQDLVSMTTEVPIPEFFPALCVVNDEDYEAAMDVLRSHAEGEASAAANERVPAAEVPFEMRGIVLAGVILVVGLFLIVAPALQLYSLYSLRRASGDDGAPSGILVPWAIIVVGIFALATAVRSYLATRRRRRAVPEGDAPE